MEVLHTKIIGPVERWREHIAMVRYGVKPDLNRLPPGVTATQPLLRRNVASAAVEGEVARAAVVTAAGRLSTWVRLNTSQQLREVMLYLFIWGEAANLRFMPELLAYLFEIARAYDVASSLIISATSSTYSQFLETRAAVPPSPHAPSNSFLTAVVKPIYECIAAEASKRSDPKKNYDDWNEAFWQRSRLEELQTKSGRLKVTGHLLSFQSRPSSVRPSDMSSQVWGWGGSVGRGGLSAV